MVALLPAINEDAWNHVHVGLRPQPVEIVGDFSKNRVMQGGPTSGKNMEIYIPPISRVITGHL